VKCPGQDTLFWKPTDIFEVPCPACGKPVEFFKDDSARTCGHCEHRFRNPLLNLGCAEWCTHAEQCLADLGIRRPKGKAS
jgi:hypothetical protein